MSMTSENNNLSNNLQLPKPNFDNLDINNVIHYNLPVEQNPHGLTPLQIAMELQSREISEQYFEIRKFKQLYPRSSTTHKLCRKLKIGPYHKFKNAAFVREFTTRVKIATSVNFASNIPHIAAYKRMLKNADRIAHLNKMQ
jgi:hypothetical protein